MPCNSSEGMDSSYIVENRVVALKLQLGEVEAMLCGLLRALDQSGVLQAMFYSFDPTQAGVTRDQLSAWWQRHCVKDKEKGTL